MKNILFVLLFSVMAFATTSRFVHFDGLGFDVDGAVDNGHINLRMLCTGDARVDDGPVGVLSSVTVVSITHPSRHVGDVGDAYYHVEMTATCTAK